MVVNLQDDRSFYKCLTESSGTYRTFHDHNTKVGMNRTTVNYRTVHEHDTKVGMNTRKVNTFRIFCIEFTEWLLPHFYCRVTE